MTTLDNKYIPTKAETRLLDVLLNPETVCKSITDICEEAGVVRNVYYDAMAKPDFVEYYHGIVKSHISAKASPLINAAMKEAEKGSFQHIKLLLEMAGMHTETKEIKHSGSVEVEGAVELVTVTPDEN